MAAAGAHGVDGSLWGDYCPGVQFPGLYAGQSAHWDRHRRLLVDVGGNGHSAGAATPVPAHWPSLTAATRWPPLWQRRWAATWGHRRLARRLLYLVPLAVLAFVWQCISLPSMKVRAHHSGRDRCCVCSVFLRYPWDCWPADCSLWDSLPYLPMCDRFWRR